MGQRCAPRGGQQISVGLDGVRTAARSGESGVERGEISLKEYLERTIFYSKRTFSLKDFEDFMYSQSQSLPESLEFVRGLARSGKYLMAVISNESAEINAYRITTFGLRDIFTAFFSSCYVGIRKPDVGIYQMALRVMQRNPDECIFVDDRAEKCGRRAKSGNEWNSFSKCCAVRGGIEEPWGGVGGILACAEDRFEKK